MIGPEVRALFERLKSEPRRLFFPFLLPRRRDLDELLSKKVRKPWGWESRYTAVKRECQDAVIGFAARHQIQPARGQVLVAFHWIEPDARHDPDNIASGGRKILLDALGPGRKGPSGWRGAGIIESDARRTVAGMLDVFTTDRENSGVEVIIAEIQLSLPLSPAARHAVVDLRS